MFSPFRRVLALVLLALAAAACGGGDVTAESTTTTLAAAEGEPTTTAGADTTPTTTAAGATGTVDGVVGEGSTVAVHYTGSLDDGEVFDSSLEREPLEFTVGSGQVIAGFDDAVRGLRIGDSVVVRIEPADAYGEIDPELVLDFPIEDVPEEFRVEGMQVLLGGSTAATVITVTADTVTVDANHPLAGQALTFDIELVEILG